MQKARVNNDLACKGKFFEKRFTFGRMRVVIPAPSDVLYFVFLSRGSGHRRGVRTMIYPDKERRERIEEWMKRRWNNGEDMGDILQLLLDFEHFLMTCEAERQSK
jgi:hypothetical protein